MHYGARFYSPRLGRFVSADTIVPQPEDPQALNRYAYVRNNPVIYRDPSGHAECVDAECRQRVHPISGNIIGRSPAPRMQTPRAKPPTLPPVVSPMSGATPTLPPTPRATGAPIPIPRTNSSNRSPGLAAPSLNGQPTNDHFHLDAVGWRLEGTIGFIIGIDINFDLVYNLHQQQLELGPGGLGFTPGDSDINFSLGAQALTFGWGVATGPLFVANLPENDRLNAWGWNAGGTVLPGGGMDVNVFGSLSEVDYPEGNPLGVFVGFGGGDEFSAYLGGGYTWNIWDLSKFY